MSATAALTPNRSLLTPQEVCETLRIAPRTLRLYVANGTLCRPLQINARKALWRRSDIDKFLASLESQAKRA